MQGDNFILPDRDRVPSVFDALVLFFVACGGRLVAGYIGSFLSLAASYFFYGITDTSADTITNLVYYMLFIVLPVTVVIRRNRGVGEYIRVRPLSGKLSLMCVATACAGVIFVTYLSYLWLIPIQELGGRLSDGGLTIPRTAPGMMMSIIINAVIPGICEELLFRGVILSAYEERGSVRALLLTSFMFMCLHGSIAGMAAEFVSGLILGFLVISTNSLFAGMIAHTVHNAALLIISYAAGARDSGSGRLLEQIGGAGGIIQVIFICVLFGSLTFFILTRIDRQRRDRDFGPAPSNRRVRSLSEYVILGSCTALIMLFYSMDLLSVTGVLK